MLTQQLPFNAQTDPRTGNEVQQNKSHSMPPRKERRRALIVPREHGAWGMLPMPLATGAAVGRLGGGRLAPVPLLTIKVPALFWLRTPLESWLASTGTRMQSREQRQLVRAVVLEKKDEIVKVLHEVLLLS
jgi:YwiC-like protein